MSSEDYTIKVVGVEKDQIRENSALSGTWIIPFKLSSTPSETWVRNHYEVSQKNSHSNNKKVQIVKDCIEVNFTAAESQQQVLDNLKLDIIRTNALCKDIHDKKLKIQADLKLRQQTQETALQKIKEDVEKLQF